ncbi:MAG TPA: hypothetical protein VHT75_00305 [Acidimicrobiales bacterium]|nr:hypothetical protein [Acidimicrobiales bacterium]
MSRWTVPLSRGGSFMIVGESGWAESSLPRRLYGHNRNFLPVCQVPVGVRDLLGEVRSYADIEVDLDNLGPVAVTRLDIGMDFVAVPEPGRLLAGLAAMRQSSVYKVRAIRSGQGQIESLTIGPKGPWSGECYDKGKESGGRCRDGHVRFEARLREPRLRSVWASEHGGTLETVAHITTERIEKLAHGTFDLLNLGARVVGRDEATRMIAVYPPLTDRQRDQLMAYLLRESCGVPISMSRNTARFYERHARLLGVRLSPDLVAPSLRLDWESANAVLEAA